MILYSRTFCCRLSCLSVVSVSALILQYFIATNITDVPACTVASPGFGIKGHEQWCITYVTVKVCNQ